MTLYKTMALVAALAVAASADTLILRDGREIHGQYLGGSARQVSIQTEDGGTQTFDVDRVQSVAFSNPGAGAEQGAFPHMGMIVPAGTSVVVRMIDPVDSSSAAVGQTFRASLDEPLMVGDDVIAPRGADAVTRLVSANQAGEFAGRTRLTLALESITIDRRQVAVPSTDVTEESRSEAGKTERDVGGGALLGAIIGGVMGGGEGAAIGAGAGAGAGAAVAATTSGEHVFIPAEARLRFRIEQDVHLGQPRD